MKIMYSENGTITGYQQFGGEPSGLYLEADIPPEEVKNYKVVDGGLVLKDQAELGADALEALNLQKVAMWAEIKSYSDEIKSKGFLYKGYHIQCDVESRSNIADMVNNSALLTYPFLWRTYENTDVEIASAEELLQLDGMKVVFISETFANRKVAQESLDVASTAEEAQAVVDKYKEDYPV